MTDSATTYIARPAYCSPTEVADIAQLAALVAPRPLTLGVPLWASGEALKTHPDFFKSVKHKEAEEHHGKRWSVGRALGTLLGASLLAAWMSEILVGAAQGTGKALGMSEVFIGIVFLAVVGGAAESGSAVAMARKNKLDLTVGIAVGSTIQIALFVAPALVLASFLIAPQPLLLSFSRQCHC